MVRWLATLAVLSHGVVVWFHKVAHQELGVGLPTTWERVFVNVVILAAPVVALVLVWTPWVRWGYLLLALSMFGALGVIAAGVAFLSGMWTACWTAIWSR